MRHKDYIEKNGLTLKVEVYYHLGGMNYFSGGSEKRGYYLSVSPVTINKNNEGKIVGETYTAFTGVKFLIKEVARKSEKTFNEALTLSEDKKEELIAHVLEKNNR